MPREVGKSVSLCFSVLSSVQISLDFNKAISNID